MTTNWDELYECGALADWIYARQATDQGIQLSEIRPTTPNSELQLVTVSAADLNATPTMRQESNGFYYTDRGFVGGIVRDGDNYIVVLRGTDMGTAGPLDIGSAFLNAEVLKKCVG